MAIDEQGNGSFLFQSLDPADQSLYTWDQVGDTGFVPVNAVTLQGNLTITPNTGLNLGSSHVAANGYTFLPNGLLMQWMTIGANAGINSAGWSSFSWPVPWPTGFLSMSMMSANSTAGYCMGTSNTTQVNVTSGVVPNGLFYVVGIGH